MVLVWRSPHLLNSLQFVVSALGDEGASFLRELV
jgi:hypothetical protein